MFLVSLYIALFIFFAGLIYKVSTWFRFSLDPAAVDITPTKRIAAAMKGLWLTLLSPKALILLKVFIFDVLLQIKVLRENFLRWLMHMLIFWGFMLLVLMHALESFISEPLFADYYSTVNPFMFLRDFFGFMVITGIAIAVFRRFILKVHRLSSNVMDYYAIAIVAVILVSVGQAKPVCSIVSIVFIIRNRGGFSLMVRTFPSRRLTESLLWALPEHFRMWSFLVT